MSLFIHIVNVDYFLFLEQFAWVREHLEVSWMKRVIITCDKTLISGDLLIDDRHSVTGWCFLIGQLGSDYIFQ